MTFTTETIAPDIAVLRGEGRLDEGGPRIVVELSAVTFMDSSGLGALVGALKTARQAGGDLRIAAPSEQVVMVLQLSNLDRVLTLFDTAGDAYRD
jgi:anti-sigma B factor antagonist